MSRRRLFRPHQPSADRLECNQIYTRTLRPKKGYESKGQAQNAITPNSGLEPYLCTYCCLWHLGHKQGANSWRH